MRAVVRSLRGQLLTYDLLVSWTGDGQLAPPATSIAVQSAQLRTSATAGTALVLHNDSPTDTLFLDVDIEVYTQMFDSREGLHIAGDESIPCLTWPTGRSAEQPFPD